MALAAQDKKRFRTIAHNLSPIVTIAQKGFTESVADEIERALSEHELIKIKIFAADRDARREIIVQVSTQAGAELIQSIGNIAVLYRASAKPDPRLSNILRHKAH
jgi:RNA-binding protein